MEQWAGVVGVAGEVGVGLWVGQWDGVCAMGTLTTQNNIRGIRK